MIFICPLPPRWSDIYLQLTEAWKQGGRRSAPPPRLLILAGWAYSNDAEKQERWQATIRWAEEHDCAELVRLAEDEKYYVYEVTTYTVGPMGGPMYLDWDSTPKTRPNNTQITAALEILHGQWQEIAGDVLADHTVPLRFTGPKLRRLLVEADPSYHPPWGEWDHLGYGEERRAFTWLRAAVNRAILPLMVDHIDFQMESHQRQRPNNKQ